MPLYNVISNEEHAAIKDMQRNEIKLARKEKHRLEQKKDNIISRAENAERMILLNRSYQEKQRMYLILIMIFVLMISAYAIIIFIQERLNIKKTTLDILLITIVAIGLITAYYTILDILRRDNIDFYKLSSDNGALISPSKMKNSVQELKGDGKVSESTVNEVQTRDRSICLGRECCQYNTISDVPESSGQYTYYDPSTYKCKLISVS